VKLKHTLTHFNTHTDKQPQNAKQIVKLVTLRAPQKFLTSLKKMKIK